MSIKYWKTQSVLKCKWLKNKWPFRRSLNFQRFVILCDPRTGSTWLHTLLNSSHQIMSHGEILTEKDLSKGLANTIWKPHHRSVKAIGCKIFYQQLNEPRFAHVFNEIVANREIKIIDLTRTNVTAAYVSLKTAEKSSVWSTVKNAEERSGEIHVDQKELKLFEMELKENRSKILCRLAAHDIFSLSYEYLKNDSDIHLIQLQEFIGVVPTKLFSLLKKQANQEKESSDH